MKPCVLLYHFQGTRRGRLLKSILVTMGVRIKNVERSEYRKPIGELAGIRKEEKEAESYEGEELPEEMRSCADYAEYDSGAADPYPPPAYGAGGSEGGSDSYESELEFSGDYEEIKKGAPDDA